jgi:hypothetical protein
MCAGRGAEGGGAQEILGKVLGTMIHTSADARAAAAEAAAKAAAAEAAAAEAAAEEEDEEETEALRAMLGDDTTSDDERGEAALLGLPEALAPEPGEEPTLYGAALPPEARAELAEEQRRRGPSRASGAAALPPRFRGRARKMMGPPRIR